MPPAPAARSIAPELWGVLALALLAAVLRAALVAQTVWADELYLFEIVHDNTLGEAMDIVHDTESTPPLYFVAAWVSAQLGDDLLWIRIPSLLLSVATVPVIYALGVRTVGRTPGLIAAALFAIAPFDLFYGTEGRAYAAVAFFSACAALSLVMLADTGRRRWAVALAAAVAGAAYAHYLAGFALGALFVFGLVAYPRRRGLVLAGFGGAALLYAPWLPSALHQFEDNTSERIGPLSGVGSGAEMVTKSLFGHPFVSLADLPGSAALVVIAVALLVAAAVALAHAVRHGSRPSTGLVLLLVLAAATPAGAALYELGDGSVFGPRYLSASVPAALLVVGALLAAGRRQVVVVLCTAAVAAGVAVGTGEMVRPEGARPDYRAIGAMLDRTAGPEEPVLELAIFRGPPARNLGYYLDRPHTYFADGAPLTGAFSRGHRSGRFHVVGADGGTQRFAPLLRMEERGFRLERTRRWDGIVPLVLLTYRSVRG